MAQGGYGGSGLPLHARTRGTPLGAALDAAVDRLSEHPATSEPDCPVRHCRVLTPVDGGRPRPGLLLEWRRAGSGWEGRVVYAAQLRPGRWSSVEEWLDAGLLDPWEPRAP